MSVYKNIEVYKSGKLLHFVDYENNIEGTIYISYGDHGGEEYMYIDYIEFSDDNGEKDTWSLAEYYINYFDDNLGLLLNAKEL